MLMLLTLLWQSWTSVCLKEELLRILNSPCPVLLLPAHLPVGVGNDNLIQDEPVAPSHGLLSSAEFDASAHPEKTEVFEFGVK